MTKKTAVSQLSQLYQRLWRRKLLKLFQNKSSAETLENLGFMQEHNFMHEQCFV